MDAYERWVARKRRRCTREDMRAHLPRCRPMARFRKGRVNRAGPDRMRRVPLEYRLDQPPARRVKDVHCDFQLASGKWRRFEPHALPFDILAEGVFEGRYLNDCMAEFPREWWRKCLGRLRPSGRDPAANRYGVASGQPLSVWRRNGWLLGDDERGWFQWYCRYCLGRRDPEVDPKQMRRWLAFARFQRPDPTPVQRQALLQWAYPSR